MLIHIHTYNIYIYIIYIYIYIYIYVCMYVQMYSRSSWSPKAYMPPRASEVASLSRKPSTWGVQVNVRQRRCFAPSWACGSARKTWQRFMMLTGNSKRKSGSEHAIQAQQCGGTCRLRTAAGAVPRKHLEGPVESRLSGFAHLSSPIPNP